MVHTLIIIELEFLKKKIENCLFATGGKEEIKSNLNTRISGSAALDMAYVAAGRYDGYFQDHLHLWDIAAGVIMVKEAGGKINDIDFSFTDEIKMRAASNRINEKMLEKLDNF